jgi:hypothetical protein
MKLVNRGFILVKPKQPFLTWANGLDDVIQFDDADEMEGNCYLIEDDFLELEPVIERNFKSIFTHELLAVTDDESEWPTERKMENFNDWFHVEAGSIVVDLQKTNLISDDIFE